MEVLSDDIFQNGMDSHFFVILKKDDRRFSRLFQSLLAGAPVVFQNGFQDEFSGGKGKLFPFGADDCLKDLSFEPDRTGKEKWAFQTVLADQKVIQGIDLLVHSFLEACDGIRQGIAFKLGVRAGNAEGDDQDAGKNDKTCGQKKDPDGF